VLGQPGHRFDRDWSSADQRRFRHAVIQLVLSTDLGLGLGVIQQFDMSKEEIAGRCSMGGSLKKKKQLTLEEKGDFSIPVDGGSETVDAPGRLKRTSSYGCESIFFSSFFFTRLLFPPPKCVLTNEDDSPISLLSVVPFLFSMTCVFATARNTKKINRSKNRGTFARNESCFTLC
jgi:hypothetical protein